MVGKRKSRDDLPSRMYAKHGAYYFVDRSNRWHRLSKNLRDALVLYADMVSAPSHATTMAAMFDRYAIEVVPTKAPRTQRDNQTELRMLRQAFGHMRPGDVRPKHVYAYLDARAAKVRANREKALLSSVFAYAIRWGIVESNPCRDVKANKEAPRRRYVTDEEFTAVLELAPPAVACAMLLAVLTGLRQGDVLALTWAQVGSEGLAVEQGKTKRRLLFMWTPELRGAVDRCRELHGGVAPAAARALLVTRAGTRYSTEGFKTMWQRTMKKAIATAVITERFTFHDLRAKAGSESEDERLLGHMDTRTLRRHYQRAPVKVTPIEGPDLRQRGSS